jgi:hypothetical protein
MAAAAIKRYIHQSTHDTSSRLVGFPLRDVLGRTRAALARSGAPGRHNIAGASLRQGTPGRPGTSKVLLTPSASVTRKGEKRSSGLLLLRAPPATLRWCAGRGTSVRDRLDSCAADPFAGLVAATALATVRTAELHVRNPA